MTTTLPGPYVIVRDNPPPRSAPTDVSVWHIAAITQKGPLVPQLITSLDGYLNVYGDRVAYGYGYDALEAFFRVGGAQAVVSRVVGVTPVKATHTFMDGAGTPAASLLVTARSYGDYANTISVAIVAGVGGGTYQIVVRYNGVVVEQSGDLTTQADAVAWALASSNYVDVTVGVSALPPAVAASVALSGGTDDHATAADANWKTAIDMITKAYGPGQVSMPGRTTTQSALDLLSHAAANNRVALVGLADTASRATLVTAAAARRTNGRQGAAFAPWAVIPGVTAGTTRIVPFSAVAAGLMARNDIRGLSPNIAAAGDVNGEPDYVIGISQDAWSEGDLGDRDLLNKAGVNVVRVMYGGVRVYGYRTLADPVLDPRYTDLGTARLLMAIKAQAVRIGERYVFDQLDGKGFTISEFGSELSAMMLDFYTDGSVYGLTAGDAFVVDVGPNVNTPVTIAALQLNAQITLRPSPHAEVVQIYITKRDITEAVV